MDKQKIEDLILEFQEELIKHDFIVAKELSEEVKEEIRERINNNHFNCEDVEVSFYENIEGQVINIAIECENCYETIIDSDFIEKNGELI